MFALIHRASVTTMRCSAGCEVREPALHKDPESNSTVSSTQAAPAPRAQQPLVLTYLRSITFALGYISITALWGTLCTLLAWMLPYRARFRVIIVWWTAFVIWWARVTCGIRFVVTGREHIPEKPCIVFCRHESTWETLFLQSLFEPQATLIKRELLRIPAFGWAFTLLKPIAINRQDSRKALKQFIKEGRARLEEGIWVVLFPEGTRMKAGETGAHQSGGAALATATGAPVLAVVHDAGRYWPARSFLKHPGTIQVRILPPVATEGLSTKQLKHEMAQRMDSALHSLYSNSSVS